MAIKWKSGSKREESWQGKTPSPASKTNYKSPGNTPAINDNIYLAYSGQHCS